MSLELETKILSHLHGNTTVIYQQLKDSENELELLKAMRHTLSTNAMYIAEPFNRWLLQTVHDMGASTDLNIPSDEASILEMYFTLISLKPELRIGVTETGQTQEDILARCSPELSEAFSSASEFAKTPEDTVSLLLRIQEENENEVKELVTEMTKTIETLEKTATEEEVVQEQITKEEVEAVIEEQPAEAEAVAEEQPVDEEDAVTALNNAVASVAEEYTEETAEEEFDPNVTQVYDGITGIIMQRIKDILTDSLTLSFTQEMEVELLAHAKSVLSNTVKEEAQKILDLLKAEG